MHSRNNLSGPSMLVGSGAIFATVPIFVASLAREGVGTWFQLAARLAFSIPVLLLFLWLFSHDSLHLSSQSNLSLIIINGLLMVSAFGTYIASITLGTPPQKAVLLVYLNPLYVALGGALFLGEKLTSRKPVLH